MSRFSARRTFSAPLPAPLFGCLWLADFPAWAATQATGHQATTQATATQVTVQPRHQPFFVHHRGCVVALSDEAHTLGVRHGWTTHRAASQCPNVLALPLDVAACAFAWEQVLAALADLTPRIEIVRQGFCTFEVPTRDNERRLLCASVTTWGARCGVAADRATAELAAYTASKGRVRRVRVGQEGAFRDGASVSVLHEAGVSPHTVERLRWFGLQHVGQLKTLSRAQSCAQFADGAKLCRFARAEAAETRPVAAYAAPRVVEERLAFEMPATQPCEWEAALDELLRRACEKLNGQGAGSLSVAIETRRGRKSMSRLLREPITHAKALHEPARTMACVLSGLLSRGAVGTVEVETVEVEAIQVRLGALQRVAAQDALWLTPEQRRTDLQQVLRALEARMPGAMRRVQARDIHSPLPEERYAFAPALEGVRQESGTRP